jgi:subtilisin family serine protease
VAIVSTVPGGFEPQSGTSTAAPHVTGLAALLLAHHPVFQGPLRFRSQQRVAALYSMIRWLCVPYGFGAERTGAGLPRLHGIEQILQPSPQQAGQRASSSGNGQAATWHAVAPSAVPGMPFGQAIDSVLSPIAGATLAPSTVDAAHMTPLFVQPALVAQAWPVQALLESLRRQYLGN